MKVGYLWNIQIITERTRNFSWETFPRLVNLFRTFKSRIAQHDSSSIENYMVNIKNKLLQFHFYNLLYWILISKEKKRERENERTILLIAHKKRRKMTDNIMIAVDTYTQQNINHSMETMSNALICCVRHVRRSVARNTISSVTERLRNIREHQNNQQDE